MPSTQRPPASAPTRPASRPTRLRRGDAEDMRRGQLIRATIEAIAELGFNATTIAEIARRANVSTGLVSFYFGDKDGLLEATLRHLGRELSRSAAVRLRDARGPRERIQAIIDSNLGASQFQRGIAAVWLAFWGQVTHSPRFARVQQVYQRRIAGNLAHALAPVAPRALAIELGDSIAAMIDGLWLRATLSRTPDGRQARESATRYVDALFARHGFTTKDPAP